MTLVYCPVTFKGSAHTHTGVFSVASHPSIFLTISISKYKVRTLCMTKTFKCRDIAKLMTSVTDLHWFIHREKPHISPPCAEKQNSGYCLWGTVFRCRPGKLLHSAELGWEGEQVPMPQPPNTKWEQRAALTWQSKSWKLREFYKRRKREELENIHSYPAYFYM